MSRVERKCPDCGGTTFVEDHAQGDIVCKGCGLVAEAHIIDERSEWRTFSDKDKEGADPNRVGGPNNPLLDGGGLATVIAKGQGAGSAALSRLQGRNVNPDKALMNAFKRIGELADKLNLQSGGIKQEACEMYKQAVQSGKLRGRSTMAICAACMYMACRQNTTPRSFKEITAVLPDVKKKDISACFKEVLDIQKRVGNNKVANAPQHPADYMKRFKGDLHLTPKILNACREMALAAKPKNETAESVLQAWDSRSPLSVAAAILYIITMIADPVPMQQVAMVTEVTEATIKAVYRDLYPCLAQLLPPDFNSPAQIARLPVPDVRGGPR